MVIKEYFLISREFILNLKLLGIIPYNFIRPQILNIFQGISIFSSIAFKPPKEVLLFPGPAWHPDVRAESSPLTPVT